MAPKGKPVNELGTVAERPDGYRVQVRVSSTCTHVGPLRNSHDVALADLSLVRASPSRDAIQSVIEGLAPKIAADEREAEKEDVAKTVGMTAPSASSAPASGASLTAEEHPSKKRARDEAVPGAIVEQGRVADPARPVRRRLNQKTPDVKKRGRKKGSRKKVPSARDRAVQSGLVPKARTAYALFTKDEMQKSDYTGVAWPVAAKRIAKTWKELGEEGRDKYKKEAKTETQNQHQAMLEKGLRKGTIADLGGVTPADPRSGHGGVTPDVLETLQFGKYIILRQAEIGRGTYGQVILAKEKNTER